eukprot:350311-Pleurochrysis_carterae.AAC.3
MVLDTNCREPHTEYRRCGKGRQTGKRQRAYAPWRANSQAILPRGLAHGRCLCRVTAFFLSLPPPFAEEPILDREGVQQSRSARACV